MAIADDLQEASFQNAAGAVTFLIPRESESGGRKVTIHEYPGSDERFVEDLGRLQPSFRVKAIIHGGDIVQQRRRFTAVLSRGQGVLVHPYLGRRNVSPVDFSLSASDQSLGEIVYDIDFVQTDAAAGLQANVGGIQDVFASAEVARGSLDAAARLRYRAVEIQDSIVKIGNRVREATGVVQSQISAVVNPVQDVFNEATKQISLVQADVLSIARTPVRLFDSMRGVYTTVLGLTQTPGTIAREWAAMTNFGSPARFLPNGQRSRTLGSIRDAIPRTTDKRRIEDDNLRIFDQYFRIEAMINSFEAEADRTFDTEEDLAFAIDRLSDDYNRIIRNQDDVTATSFIGDEVLSDANVTVPSDTVSEAEAFANGLGFDPALQESLEALRVASFAVLLADQKAPSRVDTFDLGLVDIQIAAHQLYGNQDLLDSLSTLNNDQNLAVINQPLKGLVG